VANATGINTNFATKGNVGGSVDITLDGVKKTFAIKEGQSMNDLKDQVQSAFGSTVQFNEGADGFEISVAGTGRRLSISANADTMEAIGFKKGTTVVSNQLVRMKSLESVTHPILIQNIHLILTEQTLNIQRLIRFLQL